MALVQGQAFENDIGGFFRRYIVKVGVAGEVLKSLAFDTVEAGKHEIARINKNTIKSYGYVIYCAKA
jgi:hypothetical protein